MLGLPGSRKYPNSPISHAQNNFQEDEGLCKTKKIIKVYDTQLEFPDGFEVSEKTHFCAVGMDIFWYYKMQNSTYNAHCLNLFHWHVPSQNAAIYFLLFLIHCVEINL